MLMTNLTRIGSSFVLGLSLMSGLALAQTPAEPAAPAAQPAAPAPQPAAQPAAPKPKPKPKARPKKPVPPAPEADGDQHEAGNASATVKISMNGLTARASAYYRLELRRDDHGLEATEGYTPSGTTTIRVPDFKLGLDGELNRRLSYTILIDTVNQDTLELGKVTWAVNPVLSVVLGVDYVNQGGFENKLEGYDTIYLSPYCERLMPLPGSAASFAVQAKVAGTVTMQLVEGKGTDATNDPAMQPAMTLEWLGGFGAVAPLVQFGVYNNGNSKYVAVGAQYASKTVQATFDYVMDFHATKIADKRLETVYNNVVAEAWYKGFALAHPFVKFIAFAAAEPEDSALGLEDVSYNSAVDADGRPVIDDNANVLSFGARFPIGEADHLVPYAAMDLVTATFQDPADPKATEDRGQIIMQLGASGAL
jgi:hypothetical protein